ncbi:MAG: hypothetical protein EPN56_11270 [Rhodanobacter sp.]|nr:MAG: hypothetical protein EPN56_11270 [Rhodanobacter sp.]
MHQFLRDREPPVRVGSTRQAAVLSLSTAECTYLPPDSMARHTDGAFHPLVHQIAHGMPNAKRQREAGVLWIG